MKRTMTDWQGNPTEDDDITKPTGAKTFTYRIKLEKLINGFLFFANMHNQGNSTAMITVKSTIELNPPIDPSVPLEGRFAIKCTDPNDENVTYKTKDFDVATAQAWDIERHL